MLQCAGEMRDITRINTSYWSNIMHKHLVQSIDWTIGNNILAERNGEGKYDIKEYYYTYKNNVYTVGCCHVISCQSFST